MHLRSRLEPNDLVRVTAGRAWPSARDRGYLRATPGPEASRTAQ